MATVTFKSTPVHTAGELPKVGTKTPKFELVKGDRSEYIPESRYERMRHLGT